MSAAFVMAADRSSREVDSWNRTHVCRSHDLACAAVLTVPAGATRVIGTLDASCQGAAWMATDLSPAR